MPVRRLAVVQPALPRYRIPVFARLSQRSDMELTVLFGATRGVDSVATDEFETRLAKRVSLAIGRRQLRWTQDDIDYASRKRSDVLVLEWNMNNLSLGPALLRARLSGVRSIIWGHGYSRHDSPLRSLLRYWVTHLANGVLFYDAHTLGLYLARGLPVSKAYLAQNALDQVHIESQREAWQSDPRRMEGFVRKHDLARRKVVLHVSRVQPDRRVDLLVRSIEALVSEVPQVLLVVIGAGEADVREIQRLACELDISNHVVVLGPTYDESELAPWFMSAAVVCFPGAMGLGAFHAFGYGAPVVIGNDLVQHGPEARSAVDGFNAVTFRHGDHIDLGRSLRRLLIDEELRSRLSKNALLTVQDVYTLDAMVAGFVSAVLGSDS